MTLSWVVCESTSPEVTETITSCLATKLGG
jgi:hypothetical protein